MDPLDKSQTVEIPWDEKERRIIDGVQKRASTLMWLGYWFYGVSVLLSLAVFGSKPATALAVMVVQFLMVIWMGTRAMFANMSAVLKLTLAANREMMPAFTKAARFVDKLEDGTHPAISRAEAKLAEAVDSLKAIQEAIERSTKPMPAGARREVKDKVPA
jgi:hypothetical protein